MADLEKQAIAVLPMKQMMELKLSYIDGWNSSVKRIWGKKEVDRHTFNSKSGGTFECSEKLAKHILSEVDSVISESRIDASEIEDVSINVFQKDKEYNVLINNMSINMDAAPYVKKPGNWDKVKTFFGLGKIK